MKEKKTINDINDIDGLIILDKPKNHTSNDCLSIIKRYIHPRKLGHTGTLDENATGVLVCLLGNATKCQEYLMKTGDKIYEAELILGISTDTEDITGNVLTYDNSNIEKVDLEKINEAIKTFVGRYEQIPPMYSAKKIAGKKLLNLARKGIEIERKACNVIINSIEVNRDEGLNNEIENNFDYEFNNYKLKRFKLLISCSKGTYIRTLCKDIGERMNIPSCMGELRRLATGEFKIADSISLDEIECKAKNNDYSFIRPCYYQKDNSVITFGKFETLHLGHQNIINQVVSDAKRKKIKSVILIVGNNEDSKIISKEQRISKLKYLGVDSIFNFELNEMNMHMRPEVFVDEILIRQLKAKEIIVGSDCRFGYRGVGNSELLISLCKKYNVDVKVVDKIKVEGREEFISSTLIKEEFDKGNIDLVNKLLGK